MDPVLHLAQHHEGGAAALGGTVGGGLHAQRAAPAVRVDDLLAVLDIIGALQQVRHQRGEHQRGVDRLLLGDSVDLNPCVRAGLANRLAAAEVREHRRATQLHQAQDRGQRILAPALQALQQTLTENEAARVVNGIPPENEAELLEGKLPGPLTIGVRQVLAAPASDLPAEGQLGEDELTLLIASPHRANVGYGILRYVEGHHASWACEWKGQPLLGAHSEV